MSNHVEDNRKPHHNIKTKTERKKAVKESPPTKKHQTNKQGRSVLRVNMTSGTPGRKSLIFNPASKSIWEPPFELQKAPAESAARANMGAYFPLELTTQDYMR
jgi:hypothetical protein